MGYQVSPSSPYLRAPVSEAQCALPGYYAGAIVEVTGVGQRCQRSDRIVARELGEALLKLIQLAGGSAVIWGRGSDIGEGRNTVRR